MTATGSRDTAGVLREAARVMRERAEAATPGPWRAGTHPQANVWDPYRPDAYVVHARGGKAARGDSAETTAHIAAFASPDVALAVADWLEWTAQNGMERNRAAALPVATAYLNGESP